MNLEEALDGWPSGGSNQSAGGVWPGGQPANPTWPGQTSNPTWPSGPSGGGGAWPGGNPSQPTHPTWPSPSPQPPPPGGWPNPSPGPTPGPGPGPGPSFPVSPQQNLVVPYKQNLPHGVYEKMLITIAGTIHPKAERITVNLATDRDIAFHFNPRFNEAGRQVVVRNSCVDGRWGKEERQVERFPFSRGQQFEMKIMVTNAGFKVAVNNSHLVDYQHRITPLRTINKLSIYYDLTLSRVTVETLP
ncbi:galectin-3b [Pempheris klunzingeri]|uniref:galectin-3b n=1 Tax=Pempheris klunzingeri TaxID=3127111 RepID=UPI00397EE7A7